MRFWAYILPIMLFCAPIWAQKEALAENYFEQGAYDKALSLYQRLVEEQPRQPKYVLGLVNTYQELSKFDEAINVEMYIKNVEGFEGEGDLLSRFGLEIRDQITFTVARKRFDQAITSPKILTEVGYNLIHESGDNDAPSRQGKTSCQR